MKWKLSAFREPFKSHRVGDEATELRPDMGPQHTANDAKLVRPADANSGGKRAKSERAASASHRHSNGGTRPRTGLSNGGTYALGRGRKVVVKARFRKHQAVRRGGRQRLLAAHVRYLSRPNATELARSEAFFSAGVEVRDASEVPTAWAQDRYHWRIILSPEDADQLELRRYVRDYAERLERNLDTPLEWVAVTHHNTGQPHAHLLIRGRRCDGRNLVMPRKFVSEGLRECAEELATTQLSERSEAEADHYLSRMATKQHFTDLDGLLLNLAAPAFPSNDGGGEPAAGVLHIQIPRGWSPELAGRHHLEARLESLAEMGLAERTSQRFRRPTWRLRGDFVKQLEAAAEAAFERRSSAEKSAEAANLPVISQSTPRDRHSRQSPQIRHQNPPGLEQNLSRDASTDGHELD